MGKPEANVPIRLQLPLIREWSKVTPRNMLIHRHCKLAIYLRQTSFSTQAHQSTSDDLCELISRKQCLRYSKCSIKLATSRIRSRVTDMRIQWRHGPHTPYPPHVPQLGNPIPMSQSVGLIGEARCHPLGDTRSLVGWCHETTDCLQHSSGTPNEVLPPRSTVNFLPNIQDCLILLYCPPPSSKSQVRPRQLEHCVVKPSPTHRAPDNFVYCGIQ